MTAGSLYTQFPNVKSITFDKEGALTMSTVSYLFH